MEESVQPYQQEQTRSESLVISSSGADYGCAPLQSYTPSERQVSDSITYKCLMYVTWIKNDKYTKDIVYKCITVVV